MSRSRILTSLAFAGVLLAVVAGPVRADSAPVTDKTNLISANPLPLIWGEFDLNGEHKMNEKSSITAAFSYWSLSFANYSWTAIGVGGGYRMYFSPVAPDGFYWEPRVDVATVSLKIDYSILGLGTATGSGIVFSPGAVVGRQWVWEGGFFIDLAIGAGIGIGSVEATVGPYTQKASLSGFGLKGRFALGYAWGASGGHSGSKM